MLWIWIKSKPKPTCRYLFIHVSSTKSWCLLYLVDICGSAALHHIKGGMLFVSFFLWLFLISWLTTMCSSKPSLMHHDAELCVLTFSEPAAVRTLALLFSSCGMCAPECGAGEELSSWIGTQRVLHILSASENRNQENVSWQFPLGFVEQCWGWRMKT